MARNPSLVTGIPGGSLSIEGGFIQAMSSGPDVVTIQGSTAQAGDLLNISTYKSGSTDSGGEVVSISASGGGTWAEKQTFGQMRMSGGLIYPFVTVSCASTAYSVLSSNSGKLHIIPGVTEGLKLTLPAVSSGLLYKFFVKAVSASNGLTFFSTPGSICYGTSTVAQTVNVASAADGIGGSHFVFYSEGTQWFMEFLNAGSSASILLTVADS